MEDWYSRMPATSHYIQQFLPLRHLLLSSCNFPSFCTFRRVLVSLPVLKDLSCREVHWPSAPQLSILALRSRHPASESFHISFSCHSCTFALLEWLIRTPTSSTLVDISLDPSNRCSQKHHIALPHRNLDYYTIFAPTIRVAHLCHPPAEDIACLITLSRFVQLKWLRLDIRRTDWSSTADMLRALSGGLETLKFHVYHDQNTLNSDLL